MHFLASIEQSTFCVWVRESRSLFAYPGILLLHTYGMAVLVAVVAALDLRILGFAPALPLAPIAKLFPLLWAAFWVNAATGTILLAVDATTKLANLDFWIKMVCIALGVVNQRLIERRVFGDPLIDQQPLSTDARRLAVVSLTLWLGAITTGRLLAYVGPVNGVN